MVGLGRVFLAFHLVVFSALLVLSGLFRRFLSRRPSRRLVWGATAATVVAALAIIGTTASVLVAVQPAVNFFLFIRLLSQALFGEMPVLLSFLAVAAWGARARAIAGVLGLLVLVLVGTYFEAYHREPEALQIRRHTVDLRPGQKPTGLLRVVHVSDIQTCQVGDYEAGVFRAIAALSPDLLVLTGDYVHMRTGGRREKALADLGGLFRRERLSARLGVFAVPGDVDREWPEPLSGLGFHLLENRADRVLLGNGRTLSVVGLSAETSHGSNPRALRRLLRESADADVTLVIGHSPDFVLQFEEAFKPDLSLAGHTHGGQVALPFLGALITLTRLPRQYASGLHERDGSWLHVSAGVGMERGAAPQIRFLVPPEICLIEVAY